MTIPAHIKNLADQMEQHEMPRVSPDANAVAMRAQAPLTAATPMELLDRAVQGGASVEVLERLMGLQERNDANLARKAFDAAIAAAKADIPVIIKTQEKTGAGGTYRYEDLAGIAKQIDPILAQHGLSYRFRSESNGAVKVTCIISHRDGHSEENSLSSPPDTSGSKNAIQAIGSAVTYLQRYTLKAALGLAASKDDDGSSYGRGASDVALGQDALPKSKSRPVYDALIKEMRAITDRSALTKWGLENSPRIYSMHSDFQKWFREEYANHITALKEGVTEDGSPIKRQLKASLDAEDAEVE